MRGRIVGAPAVWWFSKAFPSVVRLGSSFTYWNRDDKTRCPGLFLPTLTTAEEVSTENSAHSTMGVLMINKKSHGEHIDHRM